MLRAHERQRRRQPPPQRPGRGPYERRLHHRDLRRVRGPDAAQAGPCPLQPGPEPFAARRLRGGGRRPARQDGRVVPCRAPGSRGRVLEAQAHRRPRLGRLRPRRSKATSAGRPATRSGHLRAALRLAPRASIDAERGTRGNRLFYLAVPPAEFGPIVEGLRSARLVASPGQEKSGGPWTRVVFEKPFGHDLAERPEAQRRGRTVPRSTSPRSSGSTTTSARKPSRTCWCSGSPTRSSSPSGGDSTWTTFRFHGRRGDWCRRTGTVLRADRGHPGHRREPRDAAALSDGDGAAGLPRGRRGA